MLGNIDAVLSNECLQVVDVDVGRCRNLERCRIVFDETPKRTRCERHHGSRLSELQSSTTSDRPSLTLYERFSGQPFQVVVVQVLNQYFDHSAIANSLPLFIHYQFPCTWANIRSPKSSGRRL